METNWPAAKVESRPLKDLVPYARNAREHSADQIAMLVASIEEFGWTIPVLVDEEGRLIAGHGRIMAAKQLGIKKVPCMIAEGWTDAQKRAYTLADNKIALQSDWNVELLKEELDSLEGKFDFGTLGFDEFDIEELSGDPWDSAFDNSTEGVEAKDSKPSAKIMVRCDEAHRAEVMLALERLAEECANGGIGVSVG